MHRFEWMIRRGRLVGVSLAVALVLAASGCTTPAVTPTTPEPVATSDVVLASTTSTQDSGLFDVLIPAFEKAEPQFKIKVIAVGSGEALKMGETKDADVLLVHSPAGEKKLIADGFATARNDVMYNDFLVVGPTADPASVKGSADAVTAMVAIRKAGAAGKTSFVSRGDKSGTNTKELGLWVASKIPTPTPTVDKWYLSTGQGMGETLKVAEDKGGYTLVDRATWLSMASTLPGLAIAFEKDKALFNQYGVIVIPGSKNEAGGQAFADWIVSPDAQKVIGDYGVAKYGQQLFVPNAK
ncbi:MAG: extracellular solute-binding protein [Coriobacteriia bacterium]|nr:extracellular solute-binding protein [Coriobacteriia bacterium]